MIMAVLAAIGVLSSAFFLGGLILSRQLRRVEMRQDADGLRITSHGFIQSFIVTHLTTHEGNVVAALQPPKIDRDGKGIFISNEEIRKLKWTSWDGEPTEQSAAAIDICAVVFYPDQVVGVGSH
jgi:hypothetical protein